MNLTSNVSLLVVATGCLNTAIDMVKSGNYIGGGIMLVIAIVAFVGYEKIPPTTPTPPTV